MLPPAQRGVVIVGPGVDNGVGYITMGQVVVRCPVAETKLQDAHAGQIKLLAQLIDLMRDQPQIFGDEWQRSQLLAKRGEELSARSLDPLAVNGRFVLRRNG